VRSFNTSATKSSSSQRLRLHSRRRTIAPGFFAATDLTELKALLDRANGRSRNPKETLDNDERYRAAVSRRPSNYAVFFYLQPKKFAERLAALRAAVQLSAAAHQRTMLEKVANYFWCDALRERQNTRSALSRDAEVGAGRNTHPVFANAWNQERRSSNLSMLLNLGKKSTP